MLCFFSSITLLQAAHIVIDPGHGGKNTGVVIYAGQKIIQEKDLTLKIAFLLQKELKQKGHQVSLTRLKDQYLSLEERAQHANLLKADLLLSLHINTHNNSNIYGVETYIANYSSIKTSQSLFAVKKFDPLATMLQDLNLTVNVVGSKKLACHIQNSLVQHLRPIRKRSTHINRGVKQGFFDILLQANMPSVLIELGFLNHPEDRRVLTSSQGQRRIAKAISHAIERFDKTKSLPPSCLLK